MDKWLSSLSVYYAIAGIVLCVLLLIKAIKWRMLFDSMIIMVLIVLFVCLPICSDSHHWVVLGMLCTGVILVTCGDVIQREWREARELKSGVSQDHVLKINKSNEKDSSPGSAHHS
jgi:hypothetical protein